ncbi:hypothetical protein Tco_0173080 [Tanacetum coccineum]
MLESLGLVPRSSYAKFVCSKGDDGEVMFIKIIQDDDEPRKEGSNKGEGAATKELTMEYFDTFPTKDELTYHRYLMSGPIPSIFLRTPSSRKDAPLTLRYHATLGMCISKKLTLTLTPEVVVVKGGFQPERLTQGLKQWHGYAVSSLMDTAYWSS